MNNHTQVARETQQNPPDSAEHLDASREWLDFIRQDAEDAKERRTHEPASVFHSWLRYSQGASLGLSVRAVLGSVHNGTTGKELSGVDLDTLHALYTAILDTGRTRPNQATEHLIYGAIDRLQECGGSDAVYWCFPVGVAALRENTATADPADIKAEAKADRQQVAQHWRRRDRITAEFQVYMGNATGADALPFMERSSLRSLYCEIRNGGDPERELRELRADYPKLDSRITERVALAACRANKTEDKRMQIDTLTREQAAFMAKLEGGNDTDTTPKPPQSRVIFKTLDDIEERDIEWLWKPWIVKGEFHLLAGDSQVGKTTLLLTLAARLSAGKPPFNRPGRVLLICEEGSWEHTHKPILRVAGADTRNIVIVNSARADDGEEIPLALEIDLEAIGAQAAAEGGFDLVGVDPVIDVSASARDSYNAVQLRKALRPINTLRKQTGAAVLGITHYGKRANQAMRSGARPADLILGSGAWRQIARMTWFFDDIRDDALDSQSEYTHRVGVDGNLVAAEDRKVLPYFMRKHGPKEIPELVLGDAANEDINKTMAGNSHTAKDAAEGLLIRMLPPHEEVPAREIAAAAEEAGVSMDTVRRVKAQMKIKVRQTKDGWLWKRADYPSSPWEK